MVTDAQTARFLSRVTRSPYWMDDLERWHWHTPEGNPQGIANLHKTPELVNLLWLALGRPTAPAVYDSSKNPVFIWVLVRSIEIRPDGKSLLDLACELSLEEFSRVPQDFIKRPVEAVLIERAKRKVRDANP